MKVEDTRLENLRLLISEIGTTAAVAKRADTSPSYLSQILTRVPSRTGKPRDVGPDLARKIERGCGKPEGWMDVSHNDKDEKPGIGEHPAGYIADGDNGRLIDTILTLSDEQRKALIAFLDTITAKEISLKQKPHKLKDPDAITSDSETDQSGRQDRQK